MLSRSVRTRGVSFAFLFGPPRYIGREEAARVHGLLCDKLRQDDFTFRYGGTDPSGRKTSRTFSIQLERNEGRGGISISVEHSGGQVPIRLLMTYNWPPSEQHVKEQFDDASEAVFSALEGDWQKVVAEARLRAECSVGTISALEFIRARCLRLSDDWFQAVGKPQTFVGLQFETGATPVTEDPLEGPTHELKIETLREDARSLYIELMSQWTQVPRTSDPGAGIDVSRLRPFNLAPSQYIDYSHEHLRSVVTLLEKQGGGE